MTGVVEGRWGTWMEQGPELEGMLAESRPLNAFSGQILSLVIRFFKNNIKARQNFRLSLETRLFLL